MNYSKTYRSKSVMAVVEFKKGKFDQWIQRRLARPAVPSNRQGKASGWNLPSIVALMLTERLGEIGVSLPTAADIAEGIMDSERVMGAFAKVDGEDYHYPKIAINSRTHEWCNAESYEMGKDIWITFNLALMIVQVEEKLKEVAGA